MTAAANGHCCRRVCGKRNIAAASITPKPATARLKLIEFMEELAPIPLHVPLRNPHPSVDALVVDAAAALRADREIAADVGDFDRAGAVVVDQHVALHVGDGDRAGV